MIEVSTVGLVKISRPPHISSESSRTLPPNPLRSAAAVAAAILLAEIKGKVFLNCIYS
jgi:hypothetical protein